MSQKYVTPFEKFKYSRKRSNQFRELFPNSTIYKLYTRCLHGSLDIAERNSLKARTTYTASLCFAANRVTDKVALTATDVVRLRFQIHFTEILLHRVNFVCTKRRRVCINFCDSQKKRSQLSFIFKCEMCVENKMFSKERKQRVMKYMLKTIVGF